MKKVIIGLIIFLLGVLVGTNLYSQYDANRDGEITAQDYVVIKNYIMEQ